MCHLWINQSEIKPFRRVRKRDKPVRQERRKEEPCQRIRKRDKPVLKNIFVIFELIVVVEKL